MGANRPSKVEREMLGSGWKILGATGKHIRYVHVETGRMVSIPRKIRGDRLYGFMAVNVKKGTVKK